MKMLKDTSLAILAAIFLLAACHQAENKKEIAAAAPEKTKTPEKKAKRYGMVTGIKPEKIAYYKELHANAWPGVQKKITECHIQNYSIYLEQIGDKHYLFSYFEYTGNDFDADMKKMADDTTTQRWWRETNPTQIPLPDASAKKQTWSRMEEVFHQN